MVFLPAGATRFTDKYVRSPCQNSPMGAEIMEKQLPKPSKFGIFSHTFSTNGQIVGTIFTKFSAFVILFM